MQKQIDILAEKHNEGELTAKEREEYANHLSFGSFIAILGVKARLRLSGQSRGYRKYNDSVRFLREHAINFQG